MILKTLLIIGLVVLALVAVITVIGYLLPQGHVASREAVLNAPPAQVFATIADPARYPEWRQDVQRVEVLADAPRRWKEHAGSDVITFEATNTRSPELLEVKIADPGLPFGGTWTYELKPEGSGTRITITERGEVYNPIFRFMSRFVFGHTATLDRYLDALRRRFPQPQASVTNVDPPLRS